MKLSILMPVHNEAATLLPTVKRALDVDYPCEVELLIVDDGSSDGCIETLAPVDDPRVRLLRHGVNQGKGAAIRTAARAASGDYVIILDADLEYAPEDIPALLRPILDGDARVVYGTRTFGSHTAYSFWFVMGNKLVTLAANVLFNAYISDLETCFKLLPAEMFLNLGLRSDSFGMEAEITAKLLRDGIKIYEVPISYRARSRAEGKKLTWVDGVEALWVLGRVRAGRAHRPGRG